MNFDLFYGAVPRLNCDNLMLYDLNATKLKSFATRNKFIIGITNILNINNHNLLV